MSDKAARAERPHPVPRRVLFMPVWYRLIPDLARLKPQQASDEVSFAHFNATQTLLYKLTLLLALLSLPAIFNLVPAYWCIVPAISTSVVQWWLAVRQLKRRLPELLAVGVEVGKV
ncbi:MAG TPA: hypothetical protein VGD52_05925 [Pseudoduganella sp.]